MLIEVCGYTFIASMIIVYGIILKNAGIIRKSDYIYTYILLFLIITQITILIILFFPSNITQANESNNPIASILTPLCIGTILTLVLIFSISRITSSSVKTQEDVFVWTTWTILLVGGTGMCGALILLPDTKIGLLYRIPFLIGLYTGMYYLPFVPERLGKVKNASNERMFENSLKEYKESIMKMAIESWRFAKNYEHMINRLNTNQTERYARQLQQFVNKAEESLADVGLRVVNVEGYPYDAGMAATPLNIEDFDPDDQLVVDQMLEPIIMEGAVLAQTGTVILRRNE